MAEIVAWIAFKFINHKVAIQLDNMLQYSDTQVYSIEHTMNSAYAQYV